MLFFTGARVSDGARASARLKLTKMAEVSSTQGLRTVRLLRDGSNLEFNPRSTLAETQELPNTIDSLRRFVRDATNVNRASR